MKWSVKAISPVLLFSQNAGLVLLMRYTRMRTDRPMYFATVAVCLDEAIKLILSLIVVSYKYTGQIVDPAAKNDERFVDYMSKAFDFRTNVLMAVPALVFVVQKNLNYLALSNLDACVFQALSSGKVVTTALFCYLILGRRLHVQQVLAIGLLMVGLSSVQVSQVSGGGPSAASGTANVVLGTAAVLSSAITSGFSAAYLERFVKNADYWVKQVQLSGPAFCCAAIAVLCQDFDAVREHGVFMGFDWLVVATVVVEAMGGLLVACVIKYADAVVKNFASSLSIVAVTVASSMWLGFHPSVSFTLGSVMVMASIYLYNAAPHRQESFAAKESAKGGAYIEMSHFPRPHSKP